MAKCRDARSTACRGSIGKGNNVGDRFGRCHGRGHEHKGRHRHKREQDQIPLRIEAHIAIAVRIDGQNARRSDAYQQAIGRRFSYGYRVR